MKTWHKPLLAGLMLVFLFSLSGCNEDSKITSVSISTKDVAMLTGESNSISATVQPADLKNFTLIWSSSNESVATVDNGVITAIGAGTTEISSSSKNGYSDTCTITVRDPIVATEVQCNQASIEVLIEDSFTLTATILPENTDDTTITWASSDTSVAKVVNGEVTGISVGTATITATTANRLSATCNVSVVDFTPELFEQLLSEQPLYVSNTKYIVQSTKYKALYPDMLQAIITNNSDTNIKNAVVAFAAWDHNNLPVKILGQFDFSDGEYCKQVSYTDINLVPGDSFGSSNGYSLSTDGADISTVKACVVSYEDFNGSIWENPYYDKFVEIYSDQILS